MTVRSRRTVRWFARVLAGAAGAWVACLPVRPASAQVLPFHVYGLTEGLPQSQVTRVTQDAEGFIWVGTYGGLARFNGERFTPFFIQDGLPSNRIQDLLLDREGTLWIATVGGLCRWRGHRLETIDDPLLSGIRCRALALDAGGALWVGTERGAVRLERGRPRRLSATTGIVFDLARDGDGMLVACARGLLRLEGDRVTALTDTAALGSEPRSVVRASDGLYIGTLDGGLWLRTAETQRRLPSAQVSALGIHRLRVGVSGTLYVCSTDAGLFWRAPAQVAFEQWASRSGLPSNVVNDAFEDREGNLWLATDIGGLVRLSVRQAHNYGEAEGLPSACVFGITPDNAPGRLWVATMRGAALFEIKPKPRLIETLTTATGLTNEWVWQVLPTPRGELWVMTDSAWHVRGRGQRRLRPVPALVQGPATVPHDMVVDRTGRLWLSRADARGAVVLRDGRGTWRVWSRTDGDPVLPAGSRPRAESSRLEDPAREVTECRRLTTRRAGGVYAACGQDVLVGDGERLVQWAGSAPLAAGSYINSLLEDRQGRLWAGSDAGLARYEGGRWSLLNDTRGFADQRVYSVGEDSDGVIWVGTARGVFRFLADGTVQPLGVEDGLPHLEANRGGFFADGAGGVWLGSVGGLTHYARDAQKPSPVPPLLKVEAVDLPDRRLTFPETLNLAWSERSFTLRLALLSYRARSRTAYRARLEGLESEWLPLSSSPELRYTNVPHGTRRLLLQAVNDLGLWGEVVTLPIRVSPPFWLTGWFRGLVAALVLLAVLIGHHWRTEALRRRNVTLQRLVELRTHEIGESNRRLKEAQERLARLLETSGEAQEDLASWANAMGGDIAQAVGATSVSVFVRQTDHLLPLGEASGEMPGDVEVERAQREGQVTDGRRLLLPVSGATGELQGVLAVDGSSGLWGEAEGQLFRGFAHQLGGALEMRHIRENLASLETARTALRHRMEEQGQTSVAVCPVCGNCYESPVTTCAVDGVALEPPRVLPYRVRGRYRLVRVLGTGGMGTVFLADDEHLGREVAIKVVRPERFDDAAVRARFEREAHALARIQDPAVIALYDSGVLDDGSAFLIMERLSGRDLGALLTHSGPGGPDQVATLAEQAAGGLAAAHRAGLLHRDIKPANLFLVPEGASFRVKLLDFGLAKAITSMSELTATGAVMGTPAYMSPEQVCSLPLTPSSDVYALGAVLYECLTGRPLVDSRIVGEVFAQIVGRRPDPPSARRAGLGAEVDAVLMEALVKDPLARPSDVGAWASRLATALRVCTATEPRWPADLLAGEPSSTTTPPRPRSTTAGSAPSGVNPDDPTVATLERGIRS